MVERQVRSDGAGCFPGFLPGKRARTPKGRLAPQRDVACSWRCHAGIVPLAGHPVSFENPSFETSVEPADDVLRLTVDQLRQIARAIHAQPPTDARTAQAVASALESVALRRATRERLRKELSTFPSFRRAAQWATSTF